MSIPVAPAVDTVPATHWIDGATFESSPRIAPAYDPAVGTGTRDVVLCVYFSREKAITPLWLDSAAHRGIDLGSPKQ